VIAGFAYRPKIATAVGALVTALYRWITQVHRGPLAHSREHFNNCLETRQRLCTRCPVKLTDPAEAIVGKTKAPRRWGTARCERLGHPLEAIKFFRTFKPSIPRDLLYTLLCNTAISGLYSLAAAPLCHDGTSLVRGVWVNFVLTNCIGYGIQFRYLLCNWVLNGALRRRSCAVRTLYYMIVETASVFGGYWLGFTLLGAYTTRHRFLLSTLGLIRVVLVSLIVSITLAMAFHWRGRQTSGIRSVSR